MTTLARRYPVLLPVLVIAVTIVFVALALVVGRAVGADPVDLLVGSPSPMTFEATREIPIVDEAATEAERQSVRNNTLDHERYAIDPTVKGNVNSNLAAFFAAVRAAAFEAPVEPPAPTTTLPPPSTTTVAPDPGEETTTTTEATTTTTTTTSQPPETTTTTMLPRVLLETQIEDVRSDYPRFGDAVDILVILYNDDLDRALENEAQVFPIVEEAIETVVSDQLDAGIRNTELSVVQDQIIETFSLRLPVIPDDQASQIENAAARIAASSLQSNEFIDNEATTEARDAAVAAVEEVERTFFLNEVILVEGQLVGPVELEAVVALGLLVPEQTTSRTAIAVLGGLAVLLAAFFLWRIAPGQWFEPRHFALLGVLLVLAAMVSRIPELIVPEETPELAYVLPAVMFGYLAAILYDPRTAVLMSVPMATFTAISTQDPALTIYAAAATITPVAFVSAVSSRRELRVAVGLSALVLAPLAGAVAWLFSGSDAIPLAGLFGFVGGVVAGLMAQGLLSFLENLFQVTTTVTLLDLTDRNHPALRLLEEKAPGTFNHSILVGTLAGKAARAIGADPLLAQAAAYYHDLGKTEHPQYFIENQFGFFNPHDELDPQESADLIRRHVADGRRLARTYRIPEEVANGISMHHGTGLMRYFYHKALEIDPATDPAAYRHDGTKPRRKEMAILMLSDAVEGAARAIAQQEDSTADGLRKLIDSVVGEKLEDGQLDESDLTFGDLTRVKLALVEALIGYYHTRIQYPGFPGGPDEPPALGPGAAE